MTQETIEQVLKFRDDRNWKQFHNPKDLAISISLEAAELLEVFQWSAGDVRCSEKADRIREELADVVNYCILMADACGLDLDAIVQEKTKKNAEKYPIDKAYGSKKKYTELKKDQQEKDRYKDEISDSKKIVDNVRGLNDFEEETNTVFSKRDKEILLEFPTVYIHNWKNTKNYEVYVGETNDILRRTREHYAEGKRQGGWRKKMLRSN